MAQESHRCESCGVGVTLKEVEEGGAFMDSEHCYCAICVARLMQKVRTAQRGAKGKTVGIVFQKGLTAVGSRVPPYLLYTLLAEAALAAILLVVFLIPSRVELPGRDPVVDEEVKIKALITEADATLDGTGKAREAVSILKRADNLAVGTPWSHLVKARMELVEVLFKKEARDAFRQFEERYNQFMEKNEFDLALAALDGFPESYTQADPTFWKAAIDQLRHRAVFNRDAKKAYAELRAKLVPLRRTQKYKEAIDLLQTFPADYARTPAAMEVSRTTEEIIKERDRWVEMQRRELEQQEEMAAALEKKRLEEEERTRRAQEKKQQRIAAEAARRAEREARKKREEEDRKKREEEAKRRPPEPTEPGKEPAAGEEKGPWVEVKLKPNYLKDFPFYTPRPRFQSLGQGAVGGVLFVPYPHKGKMSGFVVKDLEKSIAVDTNADGKPDKHLPPEGGVVVLNIAYVKDKNLPCAVEIRRNGGKLEYRRYGWVAGRFKDTNILVIDENSNAKYNEVGDDAVIVGNAKGAMVLGDLVDIKGELYQIKVEEDGSMLRMKPAELPTGMLLLTKGYSGRGKLHYAVVLGAIGKDNSLVSYELSDQRKAIPVPAGEYFIFAGMVAAGNRSSVRIYGGPKTKNFKVEAGKTAAPKWGAPGVIEFKYILNRDGTLEIHSTELRLYGTLGEQYLGWGPKEFLPRVQVRTEAGKMLAEKQFKHSSDFENYYPFELLVPVQKKLQVRIIGEPKFLGPCASEWK